MSTIQPPPPPTKTGDARIDAYLQNLYKWAYVFWFYQTNDGSSSSAIQPVNIYIPGLDGEDGEDGQTIVGPQGSIGPMGPMGMPGQDGEDAEPQFFGPPGSPGGPTSMSTGQVLAYMDFLAQASNPGAPPSGVARFHASTTQGFTRFEQDNEATTNLVLGRDNVFICRNTSGSTIAKGSPVYVTGSTGNVANIALAKADSLTTLPALGIALDAISNNAYGQVMKLGILTGIDTSAYTAGNTLWVSPSVAGGFVNARPSNPNLVQRIGTVLVSGVGNGSILITIAPFVGNMETGTTAATFTAADYVGTTYNKYTLTTPATSCTLTIADGKTLTASNTLTLTATDGSTLAIGTGGTLGTAAYTASTAYAPAAGSSNIVTVGALNSGSITSGFGAIDVGTDQIAGGTLKATTTIGVGGATPSASGAGVSFPATQSASTDVNTLDDYEEGYYTPTISPQTSGTITLDTANDQLQYTKVGRLCNVSGKVIVSSVSAPVGYMRLSLPVTAASLNENADTCLVSVVQEGTTNAQTYIAFITGGTAYIQIYSWTYAGGSTTNCANYVQANTQFYVNATYVTA